MEYQHAMQNRQIKRTTVKYTIDEEKYNGYYDVATNFDDPALVEFRKRLNDDVMMKVNNLNLAKCTIILSPNYIFPAK